MANTYININHKELGAAAKAVDNYVSMMAGKIFRADSEVRNLVLGWRGTDYSKFHKEWLETKNEDSVYYNMRAALKGYASFLRYAEKQYKDAQINAVNRANGLPKY